MMFLLPDSDLTWQWAGRPSSLSTWRPRHNYTDSDMAGAIESVHWGTSVARAAFNHHIPRRTLGYRLLSCKKGHPGKCFGAYLRHQEYSQHTPPF
ncbi:hypothetical protein ACOMHN_007468 [Nucella lapillus]